MAKNFPFLYFKVIFKLNLDKYYKWFKKIILIYKI